MEHYITKTENNNSGDEVNKIGGYHRGFLIESQNRGSYKMELEKYETKIRKRILNLKAQKKSTSDEEAKKCIEKEILFLKTRLINNTDNAVYNYLANRISKHNQVNMNRSKKTQKGIAEELGLEPTVVSKSFKKLKELHIIDFKKAGSAFESIEISPRICWKMDLKIHKKVMWELDNLGGNPNFRRDPFEVDPDYLKPPEKTA